MPFPAAYTEAEVKLIVADLSQPPVPSSLQPATSSLEFMQSYIVVVIAVEQI